MTSIEQIQISGVRSFDPNPARRQTINFKKPLTVILGKNGAGKTTVIEALLNACTGQMPPGSGTEKSSFVYDPKVMGETDVKAQIRLLFTGRGEKVMQVIRSFQATRTRTKTTFATLDNTVAFQDAATGKVVSSTYRSNDVDRAVPEMLGVSPAVLEHVIFCHQEDGNWPLSPPKDVKKIFDEIFAATRYVLALDRLRENSKEFRRQQKEHEANLMALREHRDQAQLLAGDIAMKEESVRTIQLRINSVQPQLRELHAVAAALGAVERNAESLMREAAIIQGRIEEKQHSLNRLGSPSTTQTLEEMLELRQGLEGHTRELEGELFHKNNQLKEAEVKERKYEEVVLSLRPTIHFLLQREQQYKQDCAELRKIVEKEVMNELSVSWDNMNEKTLERIGNHVNEELQKAIEKRDVALRVIDEKIKGIDEQQTATLRLIDAESKEKEMKVEQLGHLRERIAGTENALWKLHPHVGVAHLQVVEKTIAELEQRREAMEALKKSGNNYRHRQDILKGVEIQNRIVAELRQELAKRKQRAGSEAELSLLQSQISEKKKFLETGLQERIIPGLSEFGCEIPKGRTLSHALLLVEQLGVQKKDAFHTIQMEQNELDRQVAVLQQKQSQLVDTIMQEELEVRRRRTICEEALGGVSELDRFEEILANARDARHNASHRQHALEAMATCYTNFLEIAEAEKRCPLCDRGFHDDATLKNFIQIYEVQQRTSPEKVVEARREMEAAERRVFRLESIEADVHDVRRLANNLLRLEKQTKLINEELANKTALLNDVGRKRDAVEIQLERVQELLRASADLNAAASEMQSLKQQLHRREASITGVCANIVTDNDDSGGVTRAEGEQLGGNCDDRTYEEVSAEYESANSELYRLNVLLSEAQRQEEGESDDKLTNELSAKRAEHYQLQVKLLRQEELEETLTHCRSEVQRYTERITAIDTRCVELRTELNKFESQMKALGLERVETLRAAQQGDVGKMEELLGVLSSVSPKLRDYIVLGHGEQLSTMQEDLREAETSGLAAADVVKRLRAEIHETRLRLDEQLQRAAEMEKHIDILERHKSIAVDQTRLQDVEHVLAELKCKEVHGVEEILGREVVARESVSRIRELIRDKVSELERSRAQQEGNVETMTQDIANLKKQLAREKYQDVEKRYRSTFLKVQTSEIAVADIEKYYRALEKAVQSYHQEKIAQINQILADLWRQTYKGSDIDTVEIRSEDDVTSTTARRSYSYRVVMKRGNSEMDMRGRCSAGQKVLASVLIRLALSEAFCCDCGILALDEPTTNLDEDNARSLAESLRMLIDNRRAVKHFQLIVITHDEQFVRALGGQALETFYYIHKDREGAFSVIEERTFAQLFAA